MPTLVHIGHFGFLSKFLVYYSSKGYSDCLFLIDVTFASPETKEFLSRWNEKTDCGKVILYKDSQFWVDSKAEELESEIEHFFDKILLSEGKQIGDYSEIYSFFDGLNAFGAYCCMKKVQYTILSIDGIAFSTWQEEFHCDPTRCKYNGHAGAYQSILRKYRAVSAYSEYVSKILCIGKHPADSRCIEYAYVDMINSISDAEYRRIVDLYGCGVKGSFDYLIPLRSYSSVIYSGRVFSEKQTPSQRLLTIYRRLLDYLLPINKTLLLKAHPNYDVSSSDIDTIPNASKLSGYYPSEFLGRDLGDIGVISIGGSSSLFLGNGNRESTHGLYLPEPFFGVGPIMDQILFCVRIMKLIGAYPGIVKSEKIRRFRAIFDYTLDKNSKLQAHILDANEISDDDVINCVSKLESDILFVINYVDKTGCGIQYSIFEVPQGGYREEHIGCLLSYYVTIYCADDCRNKVCDIGTMHVSMPRCKTKLYCIPEMMSDETIPRSLVCEASDCLWIGRSYRDGNGLPLDLSAARYWFQRAIDQGRDDAKIELFDVVDKTDKQSETDLLFSIAKSGAESGNVGLMGRLGRLYRDGLGTNRDMNEAMRWMRKAHEGGLKWAKWELFDLLWRINTPESTKEMIELITPFADEGDGPSIIRLARAYRDGRGVERDNLKALEYMRTAMSKGVNCQIELINLLWSMNTRESLTELSDIVNKKLELLG